jgi:hypothetical protein
MANVIYIPNLLKKVTGTTVGSHQCLDVNVAGGTLTFSESATAAPGSAAPPLSKVVAGNDSSGNVHNLLTDATGALLISGAPSVIVAQMDTPYLDTAVTQVPAFAASPLQVRASLPAATKALRVADTTGQFIGVYTGGSGSEVLAGIINPGQTDSFPFPFPAGTRVSLRNMQNAAISSGALVLQFLG